MPSWEDYSEKAFADAILHANRSANESDVPPLHPEGDVKYISDDEYKQSVDGQLKKSLFPLPGKFRSFYGQFHMGNPDDIVKLEEVNNHCLQDGWILAREDWARAPDGSMIIVIKCLIPLVDPKKTAAQTGI